MRDGPRRLASCRSEHAYDGQRRQFEQTRPFQRLIKRWVEISQKRQSPKKTMTASRSTFGVCGKLLDRREGPRSQGDKTLPRCRQRPICGSREPGQRRRVSDISTLIVERGARRGAAWRAPRRSFAIVDESVNIFASERRPLTNTPYCCIQTFRAITDNFDRLMGAQSVKIGLTTGSRENRQGSLGQLSQRLRAEPEFRRSNLFQSREDKRCKATSVSWR